MNNIMYVFVYREIKVFGIFVELIIKSFIIKFFIIFYVFRDKYLMLIIENIVEINFL